MTDRQQSGPPMPPVFMHHSGSQAVHPYHQGYNQVPPSAPTVIVINNECGNPDGSFCPFCKSSTQNLSRRSVGYVTLAWSFVLCFVGMPFCLCCVPFCVDSCKDIEVVCMRCNSVKHTVKAQCC